MQPTPQKGPYPTTVLVVDDDEAIARLVGSALRRWGYAADWALDAGAALAAVEAHPYELLVLDYELGGVTGLELARRLTAAQQRAAPVVVMTAHGTVQAAVDALRAGAADFLAKPFPLSLLRAVVERVVQHQHTEAALGELQLAVKRGSERHGLIGESPPVLRLLDLVARAAAADSAVLVRGETGTGKELVARALHAMGPRARGPFVAVNCAALPPTLGEAELFGHVRGAFTGAHGERPGLFREADGGTLFLDEVGELPAPLQAMLLRSLQERAVRPLGGNRELPVDVRVVAATNRDLEAGARDRTFRQDLLYRLDVVRIDVPPLRERGRDVLLLWEHLLPLAAARSGRAVTAVSPDATEALLRYSWPGNVRELANVVEQATLACDGARIERWDLPAAVGAAPSLPLVETSPLMSLAELERRHITRVLGAVGGNQRRAAELLGIDRVTLYRKLKRAAPPRPH